MNEVRAVVLVILLLFAFKGHYKGITGEIASLLSFAVSVLGVAVIMRAVEGYSEHNTNDVVQAIVFFCGASGALANTKIGFWLCEIADSPSGHSRN